MQDRIDHLESLVLGLMQRQQQPAATPDGSVPQSGTVATSVDVDVDVQAEAESPITPSQAKPKPREAHDQRQVSPSPSDYGTIRMRKSGPGYAGNTHWLAILDSISQLREHVVLDNPSPNPVPQQHAAALTVFDLDTRPLPRPRLLYGCRVQPSFSSILQAVPPRPVVDRLVSRYFNDLDMATGEPLSENLVRADDVERCQSFQRLADQRPRKALFIEASLCARYGSVSRLLGEFHG